MKHIKVVLASSSPRRKELLAEIIRPEEFMVIDSNITEKIRDGEDAESFSLRMAVEKASYVIRDYSDRIDDALVVIGADTVILFDNEIIGQPKDRPDAIRILRKLSGHCHEVITAVVLLLIKENREVKFAVRSKVWMKEISDEVIEDYIESGEPMDKAGAYAIQGIGKNLIERFEGSYTNIIGLPVDELKEALLKILS